ncbi:MAG: NAD(P)-dependent alcohol dehydrogenase [Lysobacterales bacterium]
MTKAAIPNVSAFEIGDQAGISSLKRTTRDIAAPGPFEVLVKTHAAALNYRDIMVLEARYGAKKPENRVPLGDGAGEVMAVGDQVHGVAVGDRVTAPHFSLWTDGDYSPAIFAADLGNTADGWLSEIVRLPANACVKIPDAISYESAAALGAAAITAWRVIEVLGDVKAGDVVLTLGTGGVSIMALQLASINGATVAITSSSNKKLELARSLGADITINYRERPDWENAVVEQTGGADVVVETVGLSTLDQSLTACAPNARVGFLGALGGMPDKGPALTAMLLKNVMIQGITSGSRKNLADVLRACATNNVQPHIDRRVAFGEAPEALAYLAKGQHVGKVVITFD